MYISYHPELFVNQDILSILTYEEDEKTSSAVELFYPFTYTPLSSSLAGSQQVLPGRRWKNNLC